MGEGRQAGVFCFVTKSHPLGVIAILFAATIVAAGCLEMTLGVWRDPDVAPGRRDREPANPVKNRRGRQSCHALDQCSENTDHCVGAGCLARYHCNRLTQWLAPRRSQLAHHSWPAPGRISVNAFCRHSSSELGDQETGQYVRSATPRLNANRHGLSMPRGGRFPPRISRSRSVPSNKICHMGIMEPKHVRRIWGLSGLVDHHPSHARQTWISRPTSATQPT